MVIRGGLVGSAFSTPQRPEEAVPREAAEAAPEPVDATEEAEEFENGEDFEE
jgi:hypothetical protein